MKFEENKVYHIYNKGNNQQKIFFNDENYLFFLKKIKKELSVYCELLNYCLMPNHFHLMLQTKDKKLQEESSLKKKTLNDGIGILLRSYTRAIQKQEQIKGSLFQQKTKAKELITVSDIVNCANYIHQNPAKANLVSDLKNWRFSSYNEYLIPTHLNFCNQELFKKLVIG